jgi:hypothetical protein
VIGRIGNERSELQEDSVIRKFRITAADGKSYNTLHYKLPAIIAATDHEIPQDAGKVTAEIAKARPKVRSRSTALCRAGCLRATSTE